MAASLAPDSLARENLYSEQPRKGKVRVLAVIPAGRGVMYATRQVSSLIDIGVDVRSFRLLSRTSPVVLLREYKRLRQEIHEFRPHLLHAHYGTMTSFLCAISNTVPLVITFRGSDLNGDPDASFVRSNLGKLLSQISSLRAQAIVCVSPRLRDRLWWRSQQARVLPDGVNLVLFRPEPKERVRARLGWDQEASTVIFNGVQRPRAKGAQFVRHAVQLAEQAVGPIRLIMLDGSVLPELIPSYLNAADCLALASLREGSPNVVKESLACNLPVVATDVGDVAERLEQVRPSRVVTRDVSEFAKALADVLVEKHRSNGREGIAQYSEMRIAASIRSLYEELVPSYAK